MADIVARYVGNKRVEAENPRSGGRLTFDQGKPDGLGESYDPVEGLLGAFAGCTLDSSFFKGDEAWQWCPCRPAWR